MKRVVWNSVRSRKHVVINATSFTTAADQSNVKVIEMKPSEIDARNKALALDQVFMDAAPIQGIALHQGSERQCSSLHCGSRCQFR